MSQNKAFNAIVLEEAGGRVQSSLRSLQVSDLPPGDVLVRVSHSTLNYKDGLILNGLGRLVRQYPHIPGIDFAGVVEESAAPAYKPGDAVVLTGWHVGERHWGGYSQYARVKADWLVPLPKGLSLKQAMALGTAGFTAMLAILELERNGLTPSAPGEVLVTGAAGGVGSVAVAVLAKRGYKVAAATGRKETHDYLRDLGATVLIDRAEFAEPPKKPLNSERWSGCVDATGGLPLAHALAGLRQGGAVAACGNAAGNDLATTILPFILRGVRLIGIESALPPFAYRRQVWDQLVADLSLPKLDGMTQTIGLGDLSAWAATILKGGVRGRVVVDVNK